MHNRKIYDQKSIIRNWMIRIFISIRTMRQISRIGMSRRCIRIL